MAVGSAEIAIGNLSQLFVARMACRDMPNIRESNV
jgi:hypothetical protein